MDILFSDGPVQDMLATVTQVLQRFDIDFFLIGALARDIRMSADPDYAPKRATQDADIALMLATEDQFYEIKDALFATGHFTPHDTEPIKVFYKQAIELDLLPFGGIENENRETRIQKPQPFILDVPGLQELFPDATTVTIDGLSLRVCSLEGIVLLKIIANADKPSRTKDLIDIEHIIDAYFELEMEKLFREYPDASDLYDTDDRYYLQRVSGRVIGREIARLLSGSPALRSRVMSIVSAKTQGSYWPEMAAGIEEAAGI